MLVIALGYGVCDFGILGQVGCLTVSIPDLFPLSYFVGFDIVVVVYYYLPTKLNASSGEIK